MRARILLVLGVGSVIALAGAAAAVSSSGDPQRAVVVTPQGALDAVEGFAPGTGKGASVSGPRTGAIATFYDVTGPHVSANVDVKTGRLITLLLPDKVPTRAEVAIDRVAALAVAKKFLADRHVGVAAVEPTVRLVNHGETSEFVVTWQRRVASVLVPDVRIVGIDAATGEVFRYADQQRPFADLPIPAVSQDGAVAAAIAAAGMDQPTVVAADLVVTFTPAGDQRLVWQIQLEKDVPVEPGSAQVYTAAALVEVDAQSGVAVVTGRG